MRILLFVYGQRSLECYLQKTIRGLCCLLTLKSASETLCYPGLKSFCRPQISCIRGKEKKLIKADDFLKLINILLSRPGVEPVIFEAAKCVAMALFGETFATRKSNLVTKADLLETLLRKKTRTDSFSFSQRASFSSNV